MTDLKCVICERPLTGGIDTYGPLEAPSCITCWLIAGVSSEGDQNIVKGVREVDGPEEARDPEVIAEYIAKARREKYGY